MTRPTAVEIRSLEGEAQDAAVERSTRIGRAFRQAPRPEPPLRDPARLLCGCIEPEVGPSVVRPDASCAVCSR